MTFTLIEFIHRQVIKFIGISIPNSQEHMSQWTLWIADECFKRHCCMTATWYFKLEMNMCPLRCYPFSKLKKKCFSMLIFYKPTTKISHASYLHYRKLVNKYQQEPGLKPSTLQLTCIHLISIILPRALDHLTIHSIKWTAR